ncbi:ankyrin repeat protein [Xylariales sp. PMI_506]|nr:ankyrin repeat protein [Xylariales sp. PMI_506]
MAPKQLPELPVPHDQLASYIAENPKTPIETLVQPFREYEAELRYLYAQERTNPILDDPYLNVLPLFTNATPDIKTRARNLAAESLAEKERYIMALPEGKRREDGTPAVVQSLKEFCNNFSVFCESSLSDMDWSNVVAAGSSVVNCILPVPPEHSSSKRALRQYYHEKFAPASDVDLFLYGLTEEQAIEKIKQIETNVRDAILSETTVVRTKNAITICSQYPTRHIQIVLRVYKNVSEILTGFDIDCSGAAYDGEQVYCTPRALASYITQINPIDLSRRSPSYENRLSKYSHRNFEVYWTELDRSRVDPTIFERSFARTLGLARLLVLERLPTNNAREQYLRKRRAERGRPEIPIRWNNQLGGNIKNDHEDEVAEWVEEDEVSNYHTFTMPYGPKFNAKKIEKLCYTRDLLLNAEWNQPKEREVYLHRHPAFFGRVEDVINDCCGACPNPGTTEEVEIAEKESEIYVSGRISFRIDDPGRQQIGSFNPLTDDDWTEMAYVGNTARLCQAIVDEDLEHVEDWLSQEGADPNTRDYTGRTPLHLAVTSSTPEIVRCLIDHGAKLIPRLADGRTALHIAASRGNVEIVKILLEKSSANEAEEEEKQDKRRLTADQSKEQQVKAPDEDGEETDEERSDCEIIDDDDDESDDEAHSMATGSFVKVGKDEDKAKLEEFQVDEAESGPDFYTIDVTAWDSHCSALHYAIVGGHTEVVKLLCQEFGADILSPVKFGDGTGRDPPAAILTLVLALALPVGKAISMAETLLSLGATSAQADGKGVTALHRYVNHGVPELIQSLWQNDKLGFKTAINHVAVSGYSWNSLATAPLLSAIDKGDPILVLRLLEAGANPQIDFDAWLKGAKHSFESNLGNYEANQKSFKSSLEQPLIAAIRSDQPTMALDLLARGADANVITKASHNLIENEWARRYNKGQAALDVVRDNLDALRKYEGEKIAFQHPGTKKFYSRNQKTYMEVPAGPQETDAFLRKFSTGTYQNWVVSEDIKDQNSLYEAEVERFKKAQREIQENGAAEKREFIDAMISQLEEVKKALLEKGALTFAEQYPNLGGFVESSQSVDEDTAPDYTFDFNFQGVNNITEVRRTAYIDLFEAAWRGDLEKIKDLTLTSWDKDRTEAPLQMAVSDTRGNTAFSLAFFRGHLETAKAILEIVQAQWVPREEDKILYKLKDDDKDEESCEESEYESTDEEHGIRKENIDDRFTIENIGQVSMQVKCHVLPSTFLNWNTPTFIMRDGNIEKSTTREDLMAWTLTNKDDERFKFLINMKIYYASQNPVSSDEESSKFYDFPAAIFQQAVAFGRTDILAAMIKRVGAGIPLEHLVKKSGVEMKTKPRYYQGLTVYGKKRSDWANAGRNLVVKATGSQVPPLLTAAVAGSLVSVEWFLSDTPMRHYLEFGQSKVAKEDTRLKHLSQAPGGFDKAITKWLSLQNDMVIHCAVMGPLLEYLIRICPSSLEAKSDLGYTPLYLACLLGRERFARTLIDAGADQSVKDKEYNNIIHAALTNNPKADKLRELLNLLDPEFRSHLFLQRNQLTHGGDTPLHFWLKLANAIPYHHPVWGYSNNNDTYATESNDTVEMLELLLEFSGGQDLELLNGSGDTVLHTAVIRQLPRQASLMLTRDPALLHRENSVGRTPIEIAYDFFLSLKVSRPIDIAARGDNNFSGDFLVNAAPSHFADPKQNSSGFAPVQPGGRKAWRRNLHLEGPEDAVTPSAPELVWNVIREHRDRNPGGKRRLVSLNEASDVARRLGESYSWQRYYSRPINTDDKTDNQKQEQDDAKESDFVTDQYTQKRGTAWNDDEKKKQD